MALTLEDVKRVADLARLAIDETEARSVLSQINDVFRLIAEMRAVDTRGVEPMAHALDVVQRLRADKVTESDQHDLYQSVAPQVESGFYLVPKVIE
ncbi:MAG TPA: Asp-tRNA(Asn)/Glu-tRNA(Gln) amidotransferase subunit GatC [Burkholderiales bacterium]|jgi:aspartyl-tRNA(Asn)/glutamyl-tRNA(Gln) amidotransferase subunit C